MWPRSWTAVPTRTSKIRRRKRAGSSANFATCAGCAMRMPRPDSCPRPTCFSDLIVDGCTDSYVEDPKKKESWEQRKFRYLRRVRHEDAETRFVSAADMLYRSDRGRLYRLVRRRSEEERELGAAQISLPAPGAP